jgi:hypothetical protein
MIFYITVYGLNQVKNACKYSAANTFNRDFPEKAFDHIQPRRRGGDEVHFKPGVFFKPFYNPWMLMSAIIVCDQMQIQMAWSGCFYLPEKFQIFLMTMPFFGTGDNLAAKHIKGRKKTTGSMPDVIMGHGSVSALVDGQPGLRTVQGLNLGFFINTPYQRVFRRIKVKAHDIVKFFGKMLVVGQFKRPAKVGFQLMCSPDVTHHRPSYSHGPRHGAGTPMGAILGDFLYRLFDNFLNLFSPIDEWAAAFGHVVKPMNSMFRKSSPPQANGIGAYSNSVGNQAIVKTFSRMNNYTGSQNVTCRNDLATGRFFKFFLVGLIQFDFRGFSHATSF